MDFDTTKRFVYVVVRDQMRALFVLVCACVSALGATREENYHGWPAVILSNEKVEAVVVPSIGRVMQFRFVGEEEGPFWENRALDGKEPQPESKDWINFGGDKSWPAPQADWPKVTGRGWPPPRAFDAMPVKVEKLAEELVLTTAIDPHYGIRTERRISLEPGKAVMRIVTHYEQVSGEPMKVGVWIITQLKDPELVLMALPEKSIFPLGYNKQSDTLPEGLKREGNVVSCKRSRTASTKIGSDAEVLEWRDKQWKVTIHSARIAGAEYPDQNSSAEIYTNPDPLQYVELEMLGPLKVLKPGDRLSQTNSYFLERVK